MTTTTTLSPAGRQYLLQHQMLAARLATARCPRCGALLFAGGQPAPSRRAPAIVICGPCAADESARKPERHVQPEWEDAIAQVAAIEAVRAAARAEDQLEIDARRAELAAAPPPPAKREPRPRRLTVGMLVTGPQQPDPEEP